jgi:hypothetical protein
VRYPPMKERPPDFKLNPQHPLSVGLVWAWMGRFPGGTMAYDQSPGKANGVLTGFTGAGNLPVDRWLWDRSLNRFSLYCNGTSDYINISSVKLPGGNGPIVSAACWLKWPGAGNYSVMLSYGSDSAGRRYLWYIDSSTGRQIFDPYGASSYCATALTAGAMTHVGYRLNGSSGGSLTNFFQSGKSYSPSGSCLGVNIATMNNGTIGYYASTYYPLTVADFGIWSRLLSDYEFSALADPGNVDLRVGGVPWILPIRKFWPVAGIPASSKSRRTLSRRIGSRGNIIGA